MANVRTVTVASSAANKAKRFETSASTWGELQGEISRAGLSLNNVEAIMNPGNVTLSRNEAELYPDGDFRVFLVPTKNKAGITQGEADRMAKDLTKVILDASERSGREKLGELKVEMIQMIEDFYEVDLDQSGSGFQEENFSDRYEDFGDRYTEEQAALREAQRMSRDYMSRD